MLIPSLCIHSLREGVMEFLLANHPLDCPICDQGGECDLQVEWRHDRKIQRNSLCGSVPSIVAARHICCSAFSGPVHAVWLRPQSFHGGQEGSRGQKYWAAHQDHHDALHPVHALRPVNPPSPFQLWFCMVALLGHNLLFSVQLRQ